MPKPAPPPSLTLGTILPQPTVPAHLAGRPLVLSDKEALVHWLVLGKSGMGKSELLKAIAIQRVHNRQAVAVLEPHMDLAEGIISYFLLEGAYTHKETFEKVVFIDWGRPDCFVPFNVLAPTATTKDPSQISLNAYDAVTRAWPDLLKAPMFTTLFLSATMALQANDLPLTALYPLLTDETLLARCLAKVSDDVVKRTLQTFAALSQQGKMAQAGSLLRRSFLLSFNKALRYTLGAKEQWLDIRRLMDEGKSIIIHLGNIKDQPTRKLIGCFLMVAFEQAAMSRTNIPPHLRTPMLLLVDEWASFAASETTLSTILEQTRKYGLFLCLAGQSLGQVASARIAAALENTRLQVAMGLGRPSALVMAAEMHSTSPLSVKQELVANPANPYHLSASEQEQQFAYELMHLSPQEAYVKVSDRPPIKMKTLNTPQRPVDPRQLGLVLDRYAQRYQQSEAQALKAVADLALPPAPALLPDIYLGGDDDEEAASE